MIIPGFQVMFLAGGQFHHRVPWRALANAPGHSRPLSMERPRADLPNCVDASPGVASDESIALSSGLIDVGRNDGPPRATFITDELGRNLFRNARTSKNLVTRMLKPQVTQPHAPPASFMSRRMAKFHLGRKMMPCRVNGIGDIAALCRARRDYATWAKRKYESSAASAKRTRLPNSELSPGVSR